jgi:Right handed beta helix region
MSKSKFWLSKELLMGLTLIVLVVLPVIAFGKSGVVYVDDDAKGKQDGSSDNPYKTISKALDKAKKGDEVRVYNGTYNENITIPSGVEVISVRGNREKVIIKSDNNDKPTVTMKDGTRLTRVTVKGGRHGVRVLEDAKATIYNVIIKDSKRDGIHADKARTEKSKQLVIDKVQIYDNALAGIYSEKRRISITSTDIWNNKLDGIDIEAGSNIWMEGSKANANGGSGFKIAIDGSSVWTKNNSFRYNRHDGIEVSGSGGTGTVSIKDAKLVENRGYGIARLAQTANAHKSFDGIQQGVDKSTNMFDKNGKGDLSPIIRNY